LITQARGRLREALATPRARLTGWLEQLEPRERRLVMVSAVAAALLLAWLAVVEPIADSLERLDRGLQAARRDAALVGELAARHRQLQAEVGTLERAAESGDGATSVFAQLESIAVPIAGRERITAMNPSSRSVGDQLTEESVELRIEGISMRSLVSLLHAIEQRERPFVLLRLSFKRQYKNPELLDATLVVARLRPR
jgi:Type II secretion system (T2SS), protein M